MGSCAASSARRSRGFFFSRGIAAVVSFRHMHERCLRHGEDHLAAVLIPLAVDGAIVVASMSVLLASRCGSRGGFLAWTMLMAGSLASFLRAGSSLSSSCRGGRRPCLVCGRSPGRSWSCGLRPLCNVGAAFSIGAPGVRGAAGAGRR
ncbi:DUF2637 domain-containing protein [Nonomuraea sp. NPDC002799]